jgi:hypothetical protein
MGAAAKGILVSGDSSRWPKGQYALGDAADPYFHLPLWLQIPCAAGVVWAFNERHLDYLHEYVSSEQRRRPVRTPSEPRNALLESRLPRWMKLARNRAEIVDAIQKLRGQYGTRHA